MHFLAPLTAAVALIASASAGPAVGHKFNRDSAVTHGMTNAARMAAGFNPETPRSIRDARGETYVPRASRTRHEARIAHHPVSSPSVPDTVCGIIRIEKAGDDCDTLGYISRTVNPSGEFTLVTARSSALKATIPNPFIQTKNINIKAVTTNAPTFQYFGAFISPNVVETNNFGTTVNTHALLGPTNRQAYGPSAPVGTAYSYFTNHKHPESNVETAIWSINHSTGRLSANWINDAPSATSVPARVLYSPTQKIFTITARQTTANFNAAYGTDFIDVTLNFVRD
ncbi:hypothetical protein C8R46DRAFT_1227990 [Mycena filopes]|nr:hypothetical protein C8R46DRAFT_1227990 [Mycena filopes]